MKMRIIGSPYESKERWQQMKNAWNACEEAGVQVSDELSEYFNGNEPEDDFPEIDMENLNGAAVGSEIATVNNDGFTVNMEGIGYYNSNTDPEIHFIRFRIEID